MLQGAASRELSPSSALSFPPSILPIQLKGEEGCCGRSRAGHVPERLTSLQRAFIDVSGLPPKGENPWLSLLFLLWPWVKSKAILPGSTSVLSLIPSQILAVVEAESRSNSSPHIRMCQITQPARNFGTNLLWFAISPDSSLGKKTYFHGFVYLTGEFIAFWN